MTIVELLPILRLKDPDTILSKLQLSRTVEAWIIYMKDNLSIDSEVTFFKAEHTEGELKYIKRGVIYLSFFELEHALELLFEDFRAETSNMSDLELAQALLNYRLNDA